jgi:ribosomal protein L16/L10AE
MQLVETHMDLGKRSPNDWVFVVNPNRILYEINGYQKLLLEQP